MSPRVSNRRNFIRQTSFGVAGAATAGNLSIGSVLGAGDRIRLGVIGCGSRGNSLISSVLRLGKDAGVEFAALCDVWKVNLEKTVDRLANEQDRKPLAMSRYRDLLELRDVEAVIIATPDFAHTPILNDALDAGKDAYVEKPMATRLSDARRAVGLTRENKSIVQVGTQFRSDPRYRAAAEFFRSGVLGTVSEVEASWHDCRPRWARDFSDVREEDVDWEQYQMDLPKKPFDAERFRRWHLFKDFTVGTPGLLGSHLIDVGTWLMDDPLPVSAVAHGGVYVWKDGREHADTMDCIIEYPKGFILNYSTRLGNTYPLPCTPNRPLPIVFYGTRGTFDTDTLSVRPDGAGASAVSSPIEVDIPGGDPSVNSQDAHVANWLECLRSRQEPRAPVEAGYAHSVASIMCFESWITGRRHRYDHVKREIIPG